MIKLVGVSKIYNNSGVLTTGLHNVSLELNKGEIVAITGESGSGKSTLLNILTKMDIFDEGEYYYKGNETSYFDINDMDNFRKNKVGFIFQNYNIIDSFSVLENVMLPLKINGYDNKTAKHRALELIEKVGLMHRKRNKGSELSGGEKQRCVIARALASNCEILACDEPTGNLDSKSGDEIISLIKEVAKDKLVLIVTHNFDQVKDIVTRKITVHNGEIAEDIVYDKIEKDEDVELNLDYQPIKRKIKIGIANQCLFNTPRKTILSFLVFLFVSIFALSLYQSIFYTRRNQFYDNNFYYKGEEKFIVYNMYDDHIVDLEQIKKVSNKYSVNNFYDNKTLDIYFSDNYYSYMVGYEKYPSNFKVDTGRLPVSDNECVILIPSTYQDGSMFSDSEFSISRLLNSPTFNIVRIQYRSDIKCLMLTGCEKIEKVFKVYGAFDSSNIKYYYSGNSYGSELMFTYDAELDHSYIEISYYMNDNLDSISFSDLKLFGIYDINLDLSQVNKVVSENGFVMWYIGNDIFDIIDKNPYEVAVYANNAETAMKNLEKCNYCCASVVTFTNESKLMHLIYNISVYATMIFASMVLLIIYFITYIILSRIYSTKSKDYTILRTLGVSKKDMRDIVRYEVIFQTIVSSVLVYAAMLITRHFVKTGIFAIFSHISIFASVLYFVVILCFGIMLSMTFNSRIFKFSVNSTLKGGEAKND